MKQPTLQTQYNLIKEGKGHKDVFLKEAKRIYPDIIPNVATFDETVKIFKNRGVLTEGYVDLKPINTYEPIAKTSWETKFENFLKEAKQEEPVKAEVKKTSKPVEETQENLYDNKDIENLDNQIGQEVLNGIYFEAKKAPDKTLDEIRKIVSKNLAKDRLYYMKNSAFGVEGLGYTDQAPGLKPSKTDQMEKVKTLKENLNELSHGLVNRASTKAIDARDEKDPLQAGRKYAQHWKFGEYVSPELKPYIDKLGIKHIGNSHGSTILRFPMTGEGQLKIGITKNNYNISDKGLLNTTLDDNEKRLLATLIRKIQTELNKVEEPSNESLNEGLFSKNKKPKVDGTYTVEFIKGNGKGHAKVFQDSRVAKGYKDQVNSIAKDEIAIVYPTGKRPENLGDYSANVVSENTNKLTLLTHTIMCKDENGQPRIAPKGTKVEFIDDFTFLLGGGRNGKVYTTNIEQLKGDGKNPIIPIVNKQQNIQESKKPSIDDHLTKIEKAGEMATLEAKINAVDEAMKKRQERIDMIGENEDLADLVNPTKLKEMQREIKLLEKQKNKLEKIYQKITGKKKQEVVGEVEDESLDIE